MNTPHAISENRAETYAQWFQCLADGTRLRILNFVSLADEPVTVGEIVDAIGKSQSTVSRHLAILAVDRFVFMETEGVRTLVTANPACMTALPDAAAEIMGRAPEAS
ncbi:MAG: metalloregulator ArsR/SmtB family transcription factor [Actinomycetota bacterium]